MAIVSGKNFQPVRVDIEARDIAGYNAKANKNHKNSIVAKHLSKNKSLILLIWDVCGVSQQNFCGLNVNECRKWEFRFFSSFKKMESLILGGTGVQANGGLQKFLRRVKKKSSLDLRLKDKIIVETRKTKSNSSSQLLKYPS